MYPYNFVPQQKAINFTEVFIVMPFDEKYNDIYFKLIVPATERANEMLGYTGQKALKPYRTREDISTTSGWINVLEHLLTAQIVLGVLTGENPNVFYELGVAHASEPITRQILIADKNYKPSFDIKDLIYYPYEEDLQKSIDGLAKKIEHAINTHKIKQEKKINQARMLLGPYEFEIAMLHFGGKNFVLHTSKKGREDYEKGLKMLQGENFVEGAFERHVEGIRHLCQCGLLGLNTATDKTQEGSVVHFSYHWTELGNSVLHLMGLIDSEELKNRREGLPAYFG